MRGLEKIFIRVTSTDAPQVKVIILYLRTSKREIWNDYTFMHGQIFLSTSGMKGSVQHLSLKFDSSVTLECRIIFNVSLKVYTYYLDITC